MGCRYYKRKFSRVITILDRNETIENKPHYVSREDYSKNGYKILASRFVSASCSSKNPKTEINLDVTINVYKNENGKIEIDANISPERIEHI